jgi:hypothetical protein
MMTTSPSKLMRIQRFVVAVPPRTKKKASKLGKRSHADDDDEEDEDASSLQFPVEAVEEEEQDEDEDLELADELEKEEGEEQDNEDVEEEGEGEEEEAGYEVEASHQRNQGGIAKNVLSAAKKCKEEAQEGRPDNKCSSLLVRYHCHEGGIPLPPSQVYWQASRLS